MGNLSKKGTDTTLPGRSHTGFVFRDELPITGLVLKRTGYRNITLQLHPIESQIKLRLKIGARFERGVRVYGARTRNMPTSILILCAASSVHIFFVWCYMEKVSENVQVRSVIHAISLHCAT